MAFTLELSFGREDERIRDVATLKAERLAGGAV
jgi:hypothetical protein